MKSEEYHSSKTFQYGNILLQKRVDDGSITKEEQELILQYLQNRIALQKRFGGAKYVGSVSKLTHFRGCGYLQVPWHQATKQQLISAIAIYKKQPIRKSDGKGGYIELPHYYTDNSLRTDLAVFRTFLEYLSETLQNPAISLDDINKIKLPSYRPKKLDPQNVYTEPMIAKLVETANQMMKAMVWTHYETGCRPNEICALKWGDIEFRNKSAIITIKDTKTDTIRKAFVSMNSVAHLIKWRNEYPAEISDVANVFMNSAGEPMLYQVYRYTLIKLQFYPNHDRRMPAFTPHDLRRWRATNLFRQGVNRQAICLQLWGRQQTRCDAVYSQYNTDDMYEAFEKNYGLIDETEKQRPLSPAYCPKCGTLNPAGQRFCGDCGHSLSTNTAGTVSDIEQLLIKSPEFVAALENVLKNVALNH